MAKAADNLLISIGDILATVESEMNLNFQIYLSRVRLQAQQLVAAGVDQALILQQLQSDITNSTGTFAQLKGTIGASIDTSLMKTANFSSNLAPLRITNNFRWNWEPSAEHCDTCVGRQGQVKSYEDWEAVGLPGSGTTDCGIYCRCSLEPVLEPA